MFTALAGMPFGARPSARVWEQGATAWTGRALPIYRTMAEAVLGNGRDRDWTTDAVVVKGGERAMFEGLNSTTWVDRIVPDAALHYTKKKDGSVVLGVDPKLLLFTRMAPVISQVPSYITPWVVNPETELLPKTLWWARNITGMMVSKPYDPQTEYEYYAPNRRADALKALEDKSKSDLETARHK